MGQEQSTAQPHSSRNYNTKRVQSVRQVQRVQHEGVLKLRPTPFPNCIQIDSGGSPLFLENAQTSLQELLDSRQYTNRLFPYQDVKKLIENVVYTLAYFEDIGVAYRDLSPENIYYCGGQFKLLPNELIEETLFERAFSRFYSLKKQEQQQQEFVTLSPQMIIALRYKQKEMNDLELLNKSNVFNLGMILLEACTMLPASECYEQTTYDIFNNVITERLQLAEEHYDVKIVRIIANMIDYDYSERMLMKDIAIWINREFYDSREEEKSISEYQSGTSQKSKHKSQACKSRMISNEQHQQDVYLSQKQSQEFHEPQANYERMGLKNFSRTNLVYINKYNDLKEQEEVVETSHVGPKNSIYLNSRHQLHDVSDRSEPNDRYTGYEKSVQRRQPNRYHYPNSEDTGRQPSFAQTKDQRVRNSSHVPEKYYIRENNTANAYHYKLENGTKESAPSSQSNRYYGHQNNFLREIDNDIPVKRNIENPYFKHSKVDSSTPNIGRNTQQPTHKRFYPSLAEIENNYMQSETKRMNLHSQVGQKRKNAESIKSKNYQDSYDSKQSDSKSSVNDGSINRIKLQIEKSRKLIEEFRKSEGINKF